MKKNLLKIVTIVIAFSLSLTATVFAQDYDAKQGLMYALADASMIVEDVECRGAIYYNYNEFYSAFREGMRLAYDDTSTDEECYEALNKLKSARSKLVKITGSYTVPAPSETIEQNSTGSTPLATEPTEPTIEPTEPVKVKKANTLTVKAKKITAKAKAVKNKKVTKKALTISKAKGKISVVISKITKSGKKVSAKVSKKFKLNSKGYLTIRKATKKGTYKITAKIKAKGNSKYKAKTITKIISVKVK